MKYFLVLLLSFLPLTANAATVPVALGGTGATTFSIGQCLIGNGTGAVTSSPCSGAGSISWPWTTSLQNFGVNVQATTTPEWFLTGLFASSTSYFVNASSTVQTIYNALYVGTTTPLTQFFGDTSTSSVSANLLIDTIGAGQILLGNEADFTNLVANNAGILRTAGGGSAPFDQAGSLILASRSNTTAGRGSIYFYSGLRSQNMRLDESGNLGIATGTPGSLLSLNNIANFTAATSTFYSTGGINLSAGCFAVNNTCVTGGGSASVSGGTAGMLTSWVNATTLTATSTPTASAYIATSTTATSTFAGPLRVNGNFFHLGSSTASSGDCYNNAAVCAEIIGQDNTDKGVSLIIQNTTAGGNSYGDIFMQNDNGNGLVNYGLLNLNSSVFNNSSSWGTGFSSPNQLVLQNTFGPLTVGASGAGQYINFITNGNASRNEVMRLLSGGWITMGTTTAKLGVLTAGTSTAPQLVLSDNNPASNLWTMRSINNTLFIATSTATATSSVPAIQIQSGRGLAVGTTTSVGIVNLGFNAGSSASSTIIMETLQFQGKDAAGNMRCAFLDVSGNFAVGASGVACTN